MNHLAMRHDRGLGHPYLSRRLKKMFLARPLLQLLAGVILASLSILDPRLNQCPRCFKIMISPGFFNPLGRRAWLFATACVLQFSHSAIYAQVGPAEGREGLVELSSQDARLKGHYAVPGFKVQIVAAEPAIIDPTAMAFDDQGRLYVSEWRKADRMYDTFDTIKLPEGGTQRITRRRKATMDIVKRLEDRDKDGIYEYSEVVVDGAEMPSSIFPWKGSLYLTCVGRLEKWSDEDGDGKFETRTIVADGFCGFYHHWLSGMTLGTDGWLYLTAGDNDNHVVGSDGSRVEISRCGGVIRSRPDGSRMNMFALGFRNPYRDLVFNSNFDAFVVDNDNEDGSKFQGVRLINPVEEGDYGWRLLPGAFCCRPDFDRGAVDGELPGKLPIVAKTGRGAPAGLAVYHGTAFPDRFRDLMIYPDVFRKLVRAYEVEPKGGANSLKREITLMTADDDLFRPCQTVVGPDGAIYVLDWRSNSGGAGRLWGDGQFGRLYKITWGGTPQEPARTVRPKADWSHITGAADAQLLEMLRSKDYQQADRALREIVERGAKSRAGLQALLNDKSAPVRARCLGLQGLRQLWNSDVEAILIAALSDPEFQVRRLAAQAISWEPTKSRPDFVPVLESHLARETNGQVIRELALAIGRHATDNPARAAETLLTWLHDHPTQDVATRDAFIRGIERLGETAVEVVAQNVRLGTDSKRANAVGVFSAMRTEPAARRLPDLVVLPNLSADDRLVFVRMFKDIPLNIPVATVKLVQYVQAHPELDARIELATLQNVRLAGLPAHDLVARLMDDSDESVRIAAIGYASESRFPSLSTKLASRLTDSKRSASERLAVLRALRSTGAGAFDMIAKAAQTDDPDTTWTVAVLRGLSETNRTKAIPFLEKALANSSDEVHSDALALLGEQPQTALRLGQLYVDGKLKTSDAPNVLAALRKFNTDPHRALQTKIEKQIEDSIKSIDRVALAGLVEKANPWRGMGVFLKEGGARCTTCHKMESIGGNVGPALTGAFQSYSVEKLIESMLEPSKELKEGYESYKVALKNGRVVSGTKVSQDAKTLVMREASGQELRIDVAEIDEQARETISLMPLGLVADLSQQELADLLAFLRHKPAQESLKTIERVRRVMSIGPVPIEADGKSVALARPNLAKSLIGQDGQTIGWAALDTSSAGTMNLRGQFGTNPGRAYSVVWVESPLDQAAGLRAGQEGAARVYLNGAKIGTLKASANAKPDDTPLVLNLKKGWNVITIASDRAATGENRVQLLIQSAVPVKTSAVGPETTTAAAGE
ncbi:MAG: hypothetical protein DWI24_06470 [Planctomycetota bacterium]|nr:MAG: hypothetical protein DWI24_06470 [Planctomycetota bacterium]